MSLKSKLMSEWWEPNPEHLSVLAEGVPAWNQWRRDNPLTLVVLNYARLEQAYLRGADFSNAYLIHANLAGARLRRANFYAAELYGADLSGADLSGADLRGARLHTADMRRAKVRGAHLYRADFIETLLDGCDLSHAKCRSTAFTRVDLSKVKGLEVVAHGGPSAVDVATLTTSGKLPEVFLRGCGFPDALIEYVPSLLREPIQFYSCFISHSSTDEEFAERLHADSQNKGVRCWFAPEDLKIGAEIRVGIDESIRLHDKLLLVLSETSVKSQWVQQEVETALAKEREQGRTVLFPIRLDDAVMQIATGWPAYLKNTRNIGDFTRWKEHDSYRKAFDRLLRDLKTEA